MEQPRIPQFPIAGRSWTVVALGALLGAVWYIAVELAIGLVLIAVWVWLLGRDRTDALTIFLALMPVWLYVKWLTLPTLTVAGGQFHVATALKDVLLAVFFLHWASERFADGARTVYLPPGVAIYFLVVVVGLLQAGPVVFPFLVRPYVEMFLLVAVPVSTMQLDETDIAQLLSGVLAGGGLLSLLALYHAFVDPTFLLTESLIETSIFKTRDGLSAYFGPRLQSIAGNPNNLGQTVLVTCVVAVPILFRDRVQRNKLRRIAYGGAFAGSTIVLMLSRDRDAIVLLAGALALYLVFKGTVRTFLALAVVCTAAFTLNAGDIVDTYHILVNQGNPRFRYWAAGIDFFGRRLLTGVGSVDNAFAASNPYDSSYFRMAVQIGVFGLLAFLLFNFRTVLGLTRATLNTTDRAVPVAILLALLVMLGGSAFHVSLLIFPMNLYYWLSFGLALRYLLLETGHPSDVDTGTGTAPE
jgi:hypothetical protein